MGEPERDRIVIPGWTRVAAGVLSGVIVAVVGTQAYFDQRFVIKAEHEAHEKSDREEVVRLEKVLSSHQDATRLDPIRLAQIEVQIAAIREDLRWLREHAERKRSNP